MKLPRRLFLITSALTWALSRVLPARAGANSARGPAAPSSTARTLGRYVDTLIPADQTPSGSALGVDARLRAVAAGQRDYQTLLDLGLSWLQARAQARHGRDFADLKDSQRDAIVEQMARSDHASVERMFFERTRADAFFHYYGQARSYRGIRRYRGAPQPAGFMDHAHPPRG